MHVQLVALKRQTHELITSDGNALAVLDTPLFSSLLLSSNRVT